jgi:hypothetical protein
VDGVSWPTVELDPIRRLEVLAAGIPGAALTERVLDAPFDDVWGAATDFEAGVPRIEVLIGRAEVVAREGERIEVRITPPLMGPPQRLDVVLRPGWCWMVSKLAVAGMAAIPAGDDRTRFAHLEALTMPGGRFAGPLLSAKMALARELQRIERLARERRA